MIIARLEKGDNRCRLGEETSGSLYRASLYQGDDGGFNTLSWIAFMGGCDNAAGAKE